MTTSARDSGLLVLETPASTPDPALGRVLIYPGSQTVEVLAPGGT